MCVMYPVLVSTLNEESTNWQDTHPGVLLHVGMVQIRLQFDSKENCFLCHPCLQVKKIEQCPHGVFFHLQVHNKNPTWIILISLAGEVLPTLT